MVNMPTFSRPEPRKWLTKGYWQLETPPASYATHDGWSNADVDVVPVEQRNWRASNYLFLWLADGANVGTMQQAGSIVSLGLDWRQATGAIAIGNIIIAVAIALNGAIGSRHHIPFSIASRASMGFYFSYFAVVSRLVLGFIYFGINTQIGASCMLIMLESIWPSLKKLPNTIPASEGIASNKMVAYFVFWCLQAPLVMIHPRKMRWLFFIKSIAAVIAAFAILGWSVKTAGGGGPVFAGRTKLSGSALSWAWVAGVNVAISGKTTLACNIPDLMRYAHKRSDSWWQLLHRHRGGVRRRGHLWHVLLGPDVHYRPLDEPRGRILLRVCLWPRHARHQHQHQLDRHVQRPRLPRAQVAQHPARRLPYCPARRLGDCAVEDPGLGDEPHHVPVWLHYRPRPDCRHHDRRLLGHQAHRVARSHALPERGHLPLPRRRQLARARHARHRRPHQPPRPDPRHQLQGPHRQLRLLLQGLVVHLVLYRRRRLPRPFARLPADEHDRLAHRREHGRRGRVRPARLGRRPQGQRREGHCRLAKRSRRVLAS